MLRNREHMRHDLLGNTLRHAVIVQEFFHHCARSLKSRTNFELGKGSAPSVGPEIDGVLKRRRDGKNAGFLSEQVKPAVEKNAIEADFLRQYSLDPRTAWAGFTSMI
jgi:cytochrome c2